jgi:hypothetical protein
VRRLLPLLLVAAAAGCGGHVSHRVVPARIRPMDPVPPVVVTSPLPGKRVRAADVPSGVVASSVREVVAADDGVHRMPLYVARGRNGLLCVGTNAFFRCLSAQDAQPVVPVAGFAGMDTTVFWGAVVGLVAPDLRVRVDDRPATVLRYPGFPWAVFASEITPRGPRSLQVVDPNGRDVSGLVDVASSARPCPLAVRSCEVAGPWWSAGDPLNLVPAPLRPELNLAKTVALADPVVKRVLGGRRWIASPTPWYRCSGGLIGFVIEFHFAPRGRFEEDWPTQAYDESSHTAYVTGVEHFAVSKVSGLRVNVDVGRAKVVGVDPSTRLSPTDPHPVVHYGTLHTVEKLRPDGGPDSGT